jgi:hypothetical protein
MRLGMGIFTGFSIQKSFSGENYFLFGMLWIYLLKEMLIPIYIRRTILTVRRDKNE